jgi:hypothetical protein
MKFLCVCHYDADAFAKLTPADFQKLRAMCDPHDARFKASGKVKLIGSLGLPPESRTLRVQNGKVTEESGPYFNTSEPFGAFFIVEAEDMDEAVRVARLHPGTHIGEIFGGGIEIRPIRMFEEP